MEKVAIIGLSCLFPGAHSPEAFWQNLVMGKSSFTEEAAVSLGIDPSEFHNGHRTVSNRAQYPEADFVKRGRVSEFSLNATDFNLPAKEIEQLDKTSKATLYSASEALKDSGYWLNKNSRSRCGAVIGHLSLPTQAAYNQTAALYQRVVEPKVQKLLQRSGMSLSESLFEHSAKDAASSTSKCASRLPTDVVAHALSLSTPYFCVDAAYASAFYALKLACQSLLSGQTDLMLTGAVAFADPCLTQMLFSKLGALSRHGISRPLDQQSQGITLGEGAGMIVLKRYSEALRDGDTVYATVAGIGLSNDGHDTHLLQPSALGQTTAFERAYKTADIDPSQIDYLECHATGTPLGDRTELKSIADFFAEDLPLLGAVKANVGHLLAASGMVGLLKVILSMQKNVIPPTVGIKVPVETSQYVSRESAAEIVRQQISWPRSSLHAKRAAVNAFGFGGANAHVILEKPETTPSSLSSSAKPQRSDESFSSSQPIAITGMDVCFSGCGGLDEFSRMLYDGEQQFVARPKERWQGVEEVLVGDDFDLSEVPKGAYLKQFDIDTNRYRIPPNEVHKMQPQQLLMLKVADRALQDAGILPGGNVAVIISAEPDSSVQRLQQRWRLAQSLNDSFSKELEAIAPASLEALLTLLKESFHPGAETSHLMGIIGNLTASRISSLWDFSGPAFMLSAGEQSSLQALEIAQNLLNRKEVDAVVLGAVDLVGDFEQVFAQQREWPLNTGTQTWSYEAGANGQIVGEGAGAVVLTRVEDANKKKAFSPHSQTYAKVGSVKICAVTNSPKTGSPTNALTEDLTHSLAKAPSSEPISKAVQLASQLAHNTANTQSAEVGYLEVCSSPTVSIAAESTGLAEAYQIDEDYQIETAQQNRSCAIGSVSANVGHVGATAGIASLIKTALCLHHRYIPSVPLWSEHKDLKQNLEQWKKTPFYVAQSSQSWLLAEHYQQRTAAISQVSSTQAAHVVLLEADQTARPNHYLAHSPPHLVVLYAANQAEMRAQLAALQQSLAERSLLAIAHTTYIQQKTHLPYALSLVCNNKQDLAQEINRAIEGVPAAFEQKQAWQTPAGSYFTPSPFGKDGKVAFVYPGAFNAYLGQSKDHLKLFPDLFQHSIFQETGDRYLELMKLLHPRSLKAFSRRQLEKLENRFTADPQAMFEAEMACASLTTEILQTHFQLQPQIAFGYSLGETSMMVAQGVFDAAEFGKGQRSFARSPLFNGRLSGVQNAVREFWKLPSMDVESEPTLKKPLWAIYVLVASIERISQAVQSAQRVYITQINTSEEVVIAGDPTECDRLIKSLACPFFRAPFTHVIHCPPAALEKAELENLHTFSINQKPLALYTAASNGPVAQTQQAISRNITQGLCQTLNFPKLVNQVYADGARIFVEVGAGGSCSRYIEKILAEKSHTTATLNTRGTQNKTALIKALAKLVSHKVPLSLKSLYAQLQPTQKTNNAILKTIKLGRKPIVETIANLTSLPTQPAPVSSAELYEEAHQKSHGKRLETNLSMSQSHNTFLTARNAAFGHLQELVHLQLTALEEISTADAAVDTDTDNSPSNQHPLGGRY